MPKREDERWAAEKEGRNYCSKHRKYYNADIGCQDCRKEQLALRQSFLEKQLKGENRELEQCPVCKKKSLFWNRKTKLYECLNSACVEPEELTPI